MVTNKVEGGGGGGGGVVVWMKECGILFVLKLRFSLLFHVFNFHFCNKFYAPCGTLEWGGAGWGRNDVKFC